MSRRRVLNKKKPHTMKFYDDWWAICVEGAKDLKISINKYVERAVIRQHRRDQKLAMYADLEEKTINKELA